MPEQFTILGGKVHVYKRPSSSHWHVQLLRRQEPARQHQGRKHRQGQGNRGRLVSPAARETPQRRNQNRKNIPGSVRPIPQGIRHHHPGSAQSGRRERQHLRSSVHLVPFSERWCLSEITAGKIQEYRIARYQEAAAKREKPPRAQHHAPGGRHPPPDPENRSASRLARPAPRFIGAVPLFPQDFSSCLVLPRGVQKLYEATRKRAHEPKQARFKWECENSATMFSSANTGLRPDEARRLQFHDVAIVKDEDLGQTILEIVVRGKGGSATAKACPAPWSLSKG